MKIQTIKDTPVDARRRELPKGEGDFESFGKVWSNLQKACHEIVEGGGLLSDIHVETMAIMGNGHEESMKAQQMLLRTYGYLKWTSKKSEPA